MEMSIAHAPVIDVQIGEWFAFDLSNTNEWSFMAARHLIGLSNRFVVSKLVATAQAENGEPFAMFIGRTPNLTLECQSFEIAMSALRIDVNRTTLFFDRQYKLGRPVMTQLFVDIKRAAVMLEYMRKTVQTGREPDPLVLALQQLPERVAPTSH